MGIQESTSKDVVTAQRIGSVELACVLLFGLASIVLPVMYGELYPFTIAPMFRDSPKLYCIYQVLSPDGESLTLERFQLQRNYDGNPVGLGAGLKPPKTLDRFGHAPSEQDLRSHIRKMLDAKHPGLAYVDVIQQVVGPINSRTVGVIRTTRIREYQDVQ